ncbi:MAG: DUF4091 domain-containing protein [Phycisphaerales bacterium]|nr:DUF4091 domain-containing protein [Phycisphaerales bacterium]
MVHCLFMSLVFAVVPGSVSVGLFDELAPLYPDSRVDQGATDFRLDAPRGVPVAVHVLVSGLEQGSSCTFTARSSTEPSLPAHWSRLIDVPVEENTGLDSRTEQFKGDRNPHVIRRAPFRIYEVIEPVTSPLVVDGTTMALRLEIQVPADASPGEHILTIDVQQGSTKATGRLELQVHDVLVPPLSGQTLAYTNWFNVREMADRHDLDRWSEPHWTMLRRYADLMARGRQNVHRLNWRDFFARDESGTWRLDRDRLQRYIGMFDDAGIPWIEGATIAGRPKGDWSTAWLELGMVKLPMTSQEGRAALSDLAGQMMEAIIANGWQDRWVQHLADEPTDVNAADYALAAEALRDSMPGIPIVEATMTRELTGAVDIWCPQVHKYQQNIEFFNERKAAGDQVWVYTCLVPGGPWVNRLLDQERLRQVWIGWAAAKWDLDGFLHWGLNHYKADPFQQSVVDHPAMPNTTNKLPAGDTHVVYPGPDGPLSGLRFEAHRIGLEDHAMLELLEARSPGTREEIIEVVFRGFDDWEADPAAYRRARRALMHRLSVNQP